MAIKNPICLTYVFNAIKNCKFKALKKKTKKALIKSAKNFNNLSELIDDYAKDFIDSEHNTKNIKMESQTSDGLYQLRIEAIDSKSGENVYLGLNLRDNGVAEISTTTAKGTDTIKEVDISRRTTVDAFTKIIKELQNTPPIDRMRPALNKFNGIEAQTTTQSHAPSQN
jgi:hypothetical protein